VDTVSSTHPGLVGLRADVPQRAMSPLAVIVGFDVFKHGFTHLGAAHEALAMDAFDLQAVEEASPTAHREAETAKAHRG